MQKIIGDETRIWFRVYAGIVFAIWVLFGFISPAGAKGPVSVTITGPGIDQPLELMGASNQDLIIRLMEQTGLWYATGDLPRPLESPPGDLGLSYRLTWVNGGPPNASEEERTMYQLIYLDTNIGPVIHTPVQASLENWGPGVIGWFTAPDGLGDTLAGLGVPLSKGSSAGEAGALALLDFGIDRVTWILSLAAITVIAILAGVVAARRLIRSRGRVPPPG